MVRNVKKVGKHWCSVTRFDRIFKQIHKMKFRSNADIAKKMKERID